MYFVFHMAAFSLEEMIHLEVFVEYETLYELKI